MGAARDGAQHGDMTTQSPAPTTTDAAAAPARTRVRVLVADDHPLVRDGLVRALELDRRFEVIAEAGDGRDAVALDAALAPDVAVLDVRMPGLDGIRAMQAILEQHPATKVVLLSAFTDDAVVRTALAAGAAGYLAKGTDRQALCDALALAAGGQTVRPLLAPAERAPEPPSLTEREVNLLTLAHAGHSDPMIAYILGMEPDDVPWAVDRIVAKLGAEDRVDAYELARAWGLLPGTRSSGAAMIDG